jgi:Protein of unknown function (DUF2804)
MDQVELATVVSLTGADGRLNPAAVGWARRPILDTSGIVKGPHRTWGRAKRWEYWNVISPTHILALTVSSIDYAAVHEVWIFERASGSTWTRAVTVLPARDVDLPANLNDGPARARAKDLEIDLDPLPDGGTRLRATIPEASFDVAVTRPADYDCVAVVVPWSKTRFQYTVKDVALSAIGVVTTAGVEHEVPAGSWAVLDHGRGRWPYDVTWNWGAGSGQSRGRRVGLQVGGKWTSGTGSTENGLVVDGHLYKIHDELTWEYDLADWRRPWHVTGGGLDATLVPFFDKRSANNLVVVSSRTDQCFGHWSGTYTTPHGGTIAFDGLIGWAEDVHNRW